MKTLTEKTARRVVALARNTLRGSISRTDTLHSRAILDALGEPLYHVGDECRNCGSRNTITGRGGWLLDCRDCGYVVSPPLDGGNERAGRGAGSGGVEGNGKLPANSPRGSGGEEP